MNACASRPKQFWLLYSPKFLKTALYIAIATSISFSFASPNNEFIRFLGKYLLFATAIALSIRRSLVSDEPLSSQWKLIAIAFMLWITGFSSLYLSQTLYSKEVMVYSKIHDIAHFGKMLILMWTVLMPSANQETALDRYCRISSLFVLAGVFMAEMFLDNVAYPELVSVSGALFDLANSYAFVVISVMLMARLAVACDPKARVMYGSVLACLLSEIISSAVWLGRLGRYSPKVFWDVWIADMPMLMFIIVVAWNIDMLASLEGWFSEVFEATVTSSLMLVVPVVTGITSLLIWQWQPNFVIALTIGLICVVVHAVLSLIRHVDYYSSLSAAREERRRLDAILHQDPVTGIYSRRWFDEAISLGCGDEKEGRPSIVIFMIDVDNFKSFNDTLGHKAGDYCLRAIAGALRGALGRESDAVARYGGDEMAAILFQANAQGAFVVAERMRQAVCELNINHPKNPHRRATVSIGIGIAGGTSGLIMPSDLVSTADAALYESKAKGKNTVTLKETAPGYLMPAPAKLDCNIPSVKRMGLS